MAADTVLFVFGLFDSGGLLFLTVYFWVIPEIVAQSLITLLLLIGFHWILFLFNAPMITWQIYKYLTVPSGNVGIYDPTEIHNRGMLKGHMKESMVKLGYYLLFFFIYLYCMIVSLLTRDPLPVGRYHEETEF